LLRDPRRRLLRAGAAAWSPQPRTADLTLDVQTSRHRSARQVAARLTKIEKSILQGALDAVAASSPAAKGEPSAWAPPSRPSSCIAYPAARPRELCARIFRGRRREPTCRRASTAVPGSVPAGRAQPPAWRHLQSWRSPPVHGRPHLPHDSRPLSSPLLAAPQRCAARRPPACPLRLRWIPHRRRPASRRRGDHAQVCVSAPADGRALVAAPRLSGHLACVAGRLRRWPRAAPAGCADLARHWAQGHRVEDIGPKDPAVPATGLRPRRGCAC
jgi:hypothetical protein